MQPAQALDRFVSWTEVEMIRVAENDLRAQRLDDVLRYGLDAACGADRHKHWRLDCLMRQMHLPAAAACVSGFQQIELQAHLLILLNRTPAESTASGTVARKKTEPGPQAEPRICV